jgi:hypothetical protein
MKTFWIWIILILIFIVLLVSFIHFKHNNVELFTNYDSPRVAIVTSIYGNYDNFKNQDNVNNSELVDWYCFTDSDIKASSKWKIITTPYHIINTEKDDEYKDYKNYYTHIDEKNKNMMYAKYYKIKTHEIDILQNYDYFIWIDGSIFLRDNFIDNIMKLIKNKYELINFKHSARNNVKDEVDVSIKMKKYDTQNLKEQFGQYINDKFPDNVGLFEKTVFVKKNTGRINKLFDFWWIQNLKYSFQDQISYPYSLWKTGIVPDYIIPQNVFNNLDYTYVNYNLMGKH